ncbi:MAG: hypothetical protein KGZ50_10290 [Peptococcaceae bacterium]|nr:hypothetical protein [Peptococcaceae bacterium]
MVFIYGLLALAVIFLLWRYFTPADMRLNRRFLSKHLKDQAGRGPSKITVEKLTVNLTPGQAEEKVLCVVNASFADGTTVGVLAQIFYPLEALLAERQRRRQQGEGSGASMMEMSPQKEHDQSVPEQARRIAGDPLSDLQEEAKILAEKNEQNTAEIMLLEKMNAYAAFFPTLVAHDKQQKITLLSPVSTKRLDRVLAVSDAFAKEALLGGLLTKMATWHSKARLLSPYLPAAAELTPTLMRSQMDAALESCRATVKVDVGHEMLTKLATMVGRVAEAGSAPKGIKMGEASPRAFFLAATDANEAVPFDFGRVRRDVSLLDVVELLCDPATALDAKSAGVLLEHYLATRARLEEDYEVERERRLYFALTVYYRVLLLGFFNSSVPYWTKDAMAANITLLRSVVGELGSTESMEVL